jgi:alkyl hydroperoxide reductase subunit F
MLDAELKEQLKTVFAALENNIELVYNESDHSDQSELLDMLKDVCSTSSKLSMRALTEKSATPQFHLFTQNKPNGIYFRGIPGGHEFTSLIVAILNSDNKGKLPDAMIQNRIKNLKGPIEIKTYISLSCENCPDVVQALNQMAVIHGNFKHEMIDGAYAQDEVKQLGIQGVPSVIVNGQLIHSGRIQFLDLLSKVEQTFGSDSSQSPPVARELGHFDVVVVGGGPAGASAAIYSVRKGLKTAIIAEKIGGQVQDTKGIENLISVVYTEGPQLAHQLQEHLQAYPVEILEHRRVKTITSESPKHILFDSGETLTSNAVIIATGAKWRELGIPGEKEYIGRGVAFCPHCDGPYYKGKKVAVVGGGNSGVEAAIDLAGIVREVILFEFQDALKADQVLVDKLKSLPNVSIVTSARTSQIIGDGQKVNTLEYEDRMTKQMIKVDLDGVFVQIGLLPNSGFIKDLVETTKFGEIIVDNKGRTSVKGIYAAGDVTTTPYKQIIIAMGEGAKAALAAFEDRMLQSPS